MQKYFHNFIFGVSVLPALLVMPAVAENITTRTVVESGEELIINGDNYSDLNYGTGKSGWGGAVYSEGALNIKDGLFTGNSAYVAGAVTDAIESTGALVIEDSKFMNNNSRADAGAVGVYAGRDNGGLENKITGTLFQGNTSGVYNSTNDSDGGGAILIGGTANLTLDSDKFIENKSAARGGALSIRHTSASEAVKISNSLFQANESDNFGGAFANVFKAIVSVSDTEFTGNIARKAGGAIYNGKDINYGSNGVSTDNGTVKISGNTYFTDNVATEKGGAIYNDEGGTIKLLGNVVFSGNTANGVANDIYSSGNVNIESGTTTLDGGITGTGALTVADGATLNLGTGFIEQNSMALDGALNATLLNTNKFASLDVASFTSEAGSMKLTLKGVGDYKVFKRDTFDNSKVALVYDDSLFAAPIWNDNGDTITVSMKPVEEIAANTGLKSEAAVAVSHVAEAASKSDSAQLQDLSLKIQEKLAEANTNPAAKEEVEHATKAIHPETESVAQSVSTSVQNTVVNLASARMAAPSVGRNGGDVKFTKGGVWAQGLYNKTKKNDQFTGYTRGVAAGIDGTINKDVTVGAGYAFNHSDVLPASRDTNIDSNTIFLYGQYKPSDWYVNAVLNYTFSNYEEEGTALGTRVTANYKSNTFGGQVMTGYDFASGITPELGLRYLHINGADYTNSLGIKNELKSSDYLTAMLGTKYGFDVVANDNMLFRPELHYAVKYDMISDKSSATVTMPGVAAYTVNGDRLSRIGGEFGIGLTMKYKELDLSLNYDIDVREDYTSQTGMLKARYNF